MGSLYIYILYDTNLNNAHIMRNSHKNHHTFALFDTPKMCNLPSLKQTFSPLKMDGWNTFSFPFGAPPATDRYKAKFPRIDPDTVSAVSAGVMRKNLEIM